jgi:transposase-like protein
MEIIGHATGRYFRFCLSFRAVKERLLERDATMTDEAMRQWRHQFAQPLGQTSGRV